MGGGMRLRKKGVGSSGEGGGSRLKMQEGTSKIEREEKIRGYSSKGNIWWGGGGVVDGNCY